jgi:ribonuclease HI
VHLGVVSGSTEAEFRAALVGLRRARDRRVERLRVRSDCLPVIRHLSGEEPLATRWAEAVRTELRDLLAAFETVEARWTPSSHAVERRAGVPTADALARRAVGLPKRGTTTAWPG